MSKKETVDIQSLFDLNETMAAALFDGLTYPWEILPKLSDYIRQVGPTLDPARFEKRGEDIWVARSAKVLESAYIGGPTIIDEEAEIRHGAFIRGSAIVGRGAVVGNSSELKNALLFNLVQVPHFNYVGDSVLGYRAHMGAGSIASNLKSDKTNIVIHGIPGLTDAEIETGLRKIGAILGDGADVGCNCVLNPGTVVGKNSRIYPLSRVRGVVPAEHIYKDPDHIVEME